MPTLTITNLSASRLPVGTHIGVLKPGSTTNLDLTANEIELSKDQLVSLAASGLISWSVAGTADPADDMADAAMGGGLILSGSGTPEGAVAAAVGTAFLRSDGGAGTTLYVKESGTGNTGWVGK